MKIPSNLIAAWLLLPLVTALAAADTNKMLTVDLGQGKVVEMPDTSDAAHRLNLLRLKLELLYAADFSKPLKFVKEADIYLRGRRSGHHCHYGAIVLVSESPVNQSFRLSVFWSFGLPVFRTYSYL